MNEQDRASTLPGMRLLCVKLGAMTIRERALHVADNLGFRSLPEKMRVASAIEKELISILDAAAVDLEGAGNGPGLGDRCAQAAAAQVRSFIKNPI